MNRRRKRERGREKTGGKEVEIDRDGGREGGRSKNDKHGFDRREGRGRERWRGGKEGGRALPILAAALRAFLGGADFEGFALVIEPTKGL